MKLLLVYFLVALLSEGFYGLGKLSGSTPVIPGSRKPSIFSRGHSFLKSMAREAKLPFCSDLERLALKLTRPTTAALDSNQLKQLVSLLNTDYDDPQLMIGLLVKLSRKYSESNALTKLKSLYILHHVCQSIHSKAQSAVSKSFSSLQLEMDEKLGQHFFKNSASQSRKGSSDTAGAVELCCQYSQYVFDYVPLKGDSSNSKPFKRSPSSKDTEMDRAEALMSLFALGESVESMCKRLPSALAKQLLDSVKEDRVWALAELKRLYNSGAVNNDDTKSALTALFSRLQPKRLSSDPQMKAVKSEKISLPNAKSKGTVALKPAAMVSADKRKANNIKSNPTPSETKTSASVTKKSDSKNSANKKRPTK